MRREVKERCYQIVIPSEEAEQGGWIPYPLLDASSPIHKAITLHYSVLSSGYCPHLPHIHEEEELLIILDGEAEVMLASDQDDSTPLVYSISRGEFSYYPVTQYHTIRNVSDYPVTYLMLKWSSQVDFWSKFAYQVKDMFQQKSYLATQFFDSNSIKSPLTNDGFKTKTLFEGKSRYLSKLHCHQSWLSIAAGYESHADDYDVAIVLMQGCIKVNNKIFTPPAILYFSAGEMHDMFNSGDEVANYLVFEFHR